MSLWAMEVQERHSQGMQQPLAIRETKEFSLEPPERKTARQRLDFSPERWVGFLTAEL